MCIWGKNYDLEKLMWPPDPRESFYLTTLQEHLYTFGVDVKFRRIVGLYWRVSDCEELVGVTHRKWCGGSGG